MSKRTRNRGRLPRELRSSEPLTNQIPTTSANAIQQIVPDRAKKFIVRWSNRTGWSCTCDLWQVHSTVCKHIQSVIEGK